MKSKKNNQDSKLNANAWDHAFGVVLLGVVAFVVWVGYLSYHEGLKIETSKRQGEALLEGFSKASAARFNLGFEPQPCAGTAGVGAATGTPAPWSACFAALIQAGAMGSAAVNAFSGEPVRLLAKCDKLDLTSAGHFVVEKLIPSPPGSPIPVMVAAMADTDLVSQKMQLRLSLCDKGGDTIRMGEVEF